MFSLLLLLFRVCHWLNHIYGLRDIVQKKRSIEHTRVKDRKLMDEDVNKDRKR